MDDAQFAQALALHRQTHRIKQQTAAAAGHFDISRRCMAIANAADVGKVLAALPGDSNTPDLHAAAAARGLIMDNTDRQPMSREDFDKALAQYGKTKRCEVSTAMAAGQQFLAVRCSEIAAMAESGKLLQPTGTDDAVPHLCEAAATYGLLVDAGGAPVAYQAVAPEPEPYVEGRLGGQALGPKLEGQT